MMQQQLTRKKQKIQQKTTRQPEELQLSACMLEHPYLPAQSVVGNHGVLRRYGSDVIQPKLAIGSPNGKYEEEADRIAGQVVQMSESEVYRQARGISCRILEIPPSLEEPVNAVSDGGQPLPDSVRAFFERRFGCDFTQVRIHNDPRAADSAWRINARAYTVGRHIVFGKEQYAPATAKGMKLLAHELAHVLQLKDNSTGKHVLMRASGLVQVQSAKYQIEVPATYEQLKELVESNLRYSLPETEMWRGEYLVDENPSLEYVWSDIQWQRGDVVEIKAEFLWETNQRGDTWIEGIVFSIHPARLTEGWKPTYIPGEKTESDVRGEQQTVEPVQIDYLAPIAWEYYNIAANASSVDQFKTDVELRANRELRIIGADAVVFSLSGAAGVFLGGGAGYELVYSPNFGWKAYFQAGAGFFMAGAGVMLEVGLIWNLERPEDYTGVFITVSASFEAIPVSLGGSLSFVPKDIANLATEGIMREPWGIKVGGGFGTPGPQAAVLYEFYFLITRGTFIEAFEKEIEITYDALLRAFEIVYYRLGTVYSERRKAANGVGENFGELYTRACEAVQSQFYSMMIPRTNFQIYEPYDGYTRFRPSDAFGSEVLDITRDNANAKIVHEYITFTGIDTLGGTYSSEWGEVFFSHVGDKVNGSYPGGTFAGVVECQKITYLWKQDDGSHGEGFWMIAERGTSLYGKWWYDDESAGGGVWNLFRKQ